MERPGKALGLHVCLTSPRLWTTTRSLSTSVWQDRVGREHWHLAGRAGVWMPVLSGAPPEAGPEEGCWESVVYLESDPSKHPQGRGQLGKKEVHPGSINEKKNSVSGNKLHWHLWGTVETTPKSVLSKRGSSDIYSPNSLLSWLQAIPTTTDFLTPR